LEIETEFEPPDLELNLAFLEAHFASDPGRAPSPIRNYHSEAPVSEQVRQNATPSAVLVPIVQYGDELKLLLTRRHHEISYPGQLCFPGGRADPGDRNAHATALREAKEEIGLSPDRVRILGSLGEYYTQSGFRITPVVGVVAPPLNLVASPSEVSEILEVPLSILTQARNYRIWRTDLPRNEAFYALEVDDIRVTGPTVCLAMGFYEALAESHLRLSADR
jgi:8-oxo-dGTP pyrophosphatase MutT (NUDIX family)